MRGEPFIYTLLAVAIICGVAFGAPRVKGNTSSMIYHLPGCVSYGAVIMDGEDKWFYTESSASEAGYRKALNCP